MVHEQGWVQLHNVGMMRVLNLQYSSFERPELLYAVGRLAKLCLGS